MSMNDPLNQKDQSCIYIPENCWRFLTKIDSFCIFFCRVDSVMLLEDGFEVVSSDASDKMLKTTYKLRFYFYCLKDCWSFLTKIDSFCIFFCRVDSVMLLEDGFEVVSSDASDKMLKTAYKLRWDRRRETAFDNWSRFLN